MRGLTRGLCRLRRAKLEPGRAPTPRAALPTNNACACVHPLDLSAYLIHVLFRIPRTRGKLRNKRQSLSLIAKYGWTPDLIIDVGAGHGTPGLVDAWPETPAILIDPFPDAAMLQRARPIDRVVQDAVTASGATTVDKLVAASAHSPRRVLMKVDVDGAECDVIAGASETLRGADCVVVVEGVLRDRRQGRFLDVCNAMRERDYELFDILEPLYRPDDDVLWQVDGLFVMVDSIFRTGGWPAAFRTCR